ncbi:MAG: hypothetical protein ACRC0K_00990 [Fusobacteriaceae bacterium]
MLGLISMFLIFIEATLQGKFFSLVVTLPYLAYLINGELKKSIIGLLGIIFVFSLQNSYFLYLVFFFVIYFSIFYSMLNHFSYKKENIIVFSIIQTFILFLFFHKYTDKIGLIFNFIGFCIFNYTYIKRLKVQKRR